MKNVFTSFPRSCVAAASAFMSLTAVAHAQTFYVSEGPSGIVGQVTAGGAPSTLVNLSPGNVQGITTSSTGEIYVANGSQINTVTPAGASSLYATYSNSIGGLTMSSSGILYGVSTAGGPSGGHNVGTFFSNGSFMPLSLTTTPFAPFYSAQSLRFDNSGNIFVTNSSAGGVYANSVVKLTPNGESWDITSFASLPAGFSAFDLAFDSSDNVYVSSGAGISTINKYNSSGVLDGTFTVAGLPANTSLRGLTFANDYLYAVAFGSYNLYQIDPSTGLASVFNTSPLPDYRGTYLTYSPIPEPSHIALMLSGGLALVLYRKASRRFR